MASPFVKKFVAPPPVVIGGIRHGGAGSCGLKKGENMADRFKVVVLTEHEKRIAEWLRKQRQAARSGNVSVIQGPEAKEKYTDQGFMGEFAFCKALNVYPDMTVGEIVAADCFAFGGTWDVKTTTYLNGYLAVYKGKRKRPCDFYAQVIQGPNAEWFKITGWVTGRELFQSHNLIDLGNGPCYAVEQANLHNFAFPKEGNDG